MKISNGQIKLDLGLGDPEKYLREVIEPFQYGISNRKISLNITKSMQYSRFEIDWRLYQLAMFNLIQNAVKFNEDRGFIEIQLKLVPLRNRSVLLNSHWETSSYIFQTIITNTGSEISKERIPNMMKLFGELQQKQSIHKVKDKGIGVGLTCSKVISNAMKGDLIIVENERDYPCTTLMLTIPVKI